MLRLIGWVIKLTVFAVGVLVLGNWIYVGDHTVNDQIRMQLSHAERGDWGDTLRGWTGSPEAERHQSAARHHSARHYLAEEKKEARAQSGPPQEKVSPSERQKLRSLIQELNTTGSSTARN